MELMVKHLKPYHIKADRNNLYVIVSPFYFTLIINKEEFQFAPAKEKEIIISRREQKITNANAEFAFQKGKEMIYISMIELMRIPDFLIMLSRIAAPFFLEEKIMAHKMDSNGVLIAEFERLNIKRLIDKALDERDEKSFYTLLNLL